MKGFGGAILALSITVSLAAAPAQAATVGTEDGFTYVKKSKKLGDTSAGTVAAERPAAKCPKGQKPTGGGLGVTGALASQSYVAGTGPKGRKWITGGWTFDTTAAKATAWAICTKEKVRVSSDTDSVEPNTSGALAAPCGSDAATGGGVRPGGGVEEWWLNTSYPQDGGADPDNKPDDSWLSFIWHRPVAPPTDVIFDAVCMDDVKPKYKSDSLDLVTAPEINMVVSCPKKTVVVGGGVEVSGAASATHIAATQPFDSPDQGKAPDDGWTVTVANPSMDPTDVAAHAVCL